MSVLHIVKYNAKRGTFPAEMEPRLQDYLRLSSDLLTGRHVKQTIRVIVSTPPLRRITRSMVFHAFATNRTVYGTIEDLGPMFADWFQETGILPIINPIPMRYYLEPEMLPKNLYSLISTRGVEIYSYAPST